MMEASTKMVRVAADAVAVDSAVMAPDAAAVAAADGLMDSLNVFQYTALNGAVIRYDIRQPSLRMKKHVCARACLAGGDHFCHAG